MSHGRHGGEVNIAGIGVDGALGKQLFKSAVVAGAKAGQVIVAKLVDDDGEDELRVRGFRTRRKYCKCNKKRENEPQSTHVDSVTGKLTNNDAQGLGVALIAGH